MCRNYCQREKFYFTFALEIVSGGKYYYVEICKLYESVNDYVNTARGCITNIRVRGYIRPILEFEWGNLQFLDKGVGLTIEEEKEIRVSWNTGRCLRKIFRKDYKINPIFRIKGEIVRMNYKEGLKDINEELESEM